MKDFKESYLHQDLNLRRKKTIENLCTLFAISIKDFHVPETTSRSWPLCFQFPSCYFIFILLLMIAFLRNTLQRKLLNYSFDLFRKRLVNTYKKRNLKKQTPAMESSAVSALCFLTSSEEEFAACCSLTRELDCKLVEQHHVDIVLRTIIGNKHFTLLS